MIIMNKLLLVIITLCVAVPANAFLSGSRGTSSSGGGVTPGTNDFFYNPNNIVPAGTGNIWYVNPTTGSDSNTCKSPATACATVNHAISLAGNGTGDVIVGLATQSFYNEAIVMNKDFLNLVCARPSLDAPGFIGCTNEPDLGVPLTITGYGDSVYHWFMGSGDVVSTAVNLVGSGTNGCHGAKLVGDFFVPFASSGNVNPALKIDSGAHGCSNLFLSNSQIDDAAIGIDAHNSGGFGSIIRNTIFSNMTGLSIKSNDAQSLASATIADNTFQASDASPYINVSSVSGAAPPPAIVSNHFPTGVLTATDVVLPAGTVLGQNDPPGATGSPVTSTTNTLISSHITNSAQTIFTASGNIDISKITLATTSTGLATGTALELTTDNGVGAATLCSQAVTGLGASATVDCAAASVTTFKAFRLLSGKSIKVDCSVLACTGAGTITVNLFATRAAPYASFTNVALP